MGKCVRHLSFRYTSDCTCGWIVGPWIGAPVLITLSFGLLALEESYDFVKVRLP